MKDAFAQGKLAFEHNHAMSSCDYPVGSSLRAEWMAGWTQASNTRPQDGRNGGGQMPRDTGDDREATAHRL